MAKDFSDDFLWGASITAPLSEGAYNAGSRGRSTCDMLTGGSKIFPRLISEYDEENRKYPERQGSDFYNHYREDIALMALCGVKTMGLSISWSRLYPTGEEMEPAKEGIEYYLEVFRELRKFNIEPIVTLFADDTPLALAKKWDGWADRRTIKYFLRYAKRVMIEFKYYVRRWITFEHINNLMGYRAAYESGGIIPEYRVLTENVTESNLQLEKRRAALYHQILANALVVREGKRINGKCQIGCGFDAHCFYPLTSSPADNAACREYSDYADFYCADIVCGKTNGVKLPEFPEASLRDWLEGDEEIVRQSTVDFIALRYFDSGCVSADINKMRYFRCALKPLDNPLSLKDKSDSMGIRLVLNAFYSRYTKPILISASGMYYEDAPEEDGAIRDDYRIKYMEGLTREIKKAASEGVEIFGCMVWSAIDQVFFESGEFRLRSGLIYVNNSDEAPGDYSRIPKDSFYWYKAFIASQK